MLALFRHDNKIFCAVITVDNKMIAHGARPLDPGAPIMSVIIYEPSVGGEIPPANGDSSTFELPFGTAISPLPAGTVLPWEK